MKSDVLKSLAVAGAVIALALVASAARAQGLIDHDATTRIVIVAIGLSIVWQANRIPKTFVPGAHARKAQRVAAWALVIGGLIYAAAFAFAPMNVAVMVGCGAVATALLVAFGYCLSLRRRAPAA